MFPQAVSKTLFALLLSQLTFIGYTLIRKGVFQIMLLAPLPFLTVFFTLFVQHRYVEPSKKLSLERAVMIDSFLSDQSPEFSDEAYQQPVLTEKHHYPVCEDDDLRMDVIKNLNRLQSSVSDSARRRVASGVAWCGERSEAAIRIAVDGLHPVCDDASGCSIDHSII